MYSILLSNRAEKQLDKFDNKQYQKIKIAILTLKDNPRPFGCIKLTNQEGYRIRVGSYRILFEIDDSEKNVKIYSVKHRKDAYRK
ncbi:MAG: type II toxin-antitoxin system RelE/ParE family toxin [Candidatus Brocadiales bacterium]|nr:type II toxin-antitoxin system RelE/ParE family toxin [Candidatus Brocadiales bacterium]